MEVTFDFKDEIITGTLAGKEDDWIFRSGSNHFIRLIPSGIISISVGDYQKYFTNSENEEQKDLFSQISRIAYTFLVRKDKVHNYYTITGVCAELNSINRNENIKYLVAPIGDVHMRKFEENIYEYGWDYKHDHYINLKYTIYEVTAHHDSTGKFIRFVFDRLYPGLAVKD